MAKKTRLDLHEVLCDLLGTRHVYFQPPDTVRMVYPAIVYSLSRYDNIPADNRVYIQSHLYEITVIDKDPDSEIASKVSLLPGIRFDRPYKAENLNHWVFTLNY